MTEKDLQVERNSAIEILRAKADEIEALGDDVSAEDLEAKRSELRDAEASLKAIDARISDAKAIARAREAAPEPVEVTPDVTVKREDPVYRPDRDWSLVGDVIRARNGGDAEALDRIQRHNRMAADELKSSGIQRDVTAAAGAAGIVPPSYLKEMAAMSETYGRPFLANVSRFPFPSKGTAHTLPVTATRPTVAAQTEGNALSETDIDINTQTYYTALHGGIQDVSLQAYDLTDPSFDSFTLSEMLSDYYEKTEQSALDGAGTAGLTLGVRNVSSILTVTWTEATPTGADFLSQVYNAFSQIHSNLYQPPDCIVMHPRRAAWLANARDTNHPLLQQGAYSNAVGSQNDGVVGTLAGVPVIASPAVTTTDGAGTNEDVVLVMAKRKMSYAEGPFVIETMREPLADTGEIRMRLYAYSLFVSGRYPNAIAEIGGTGLVEPTF